MMFATGQLRVDFDSIEFHAQPERSSSFFAQSSMPTPYVNLRVDFSFQVPWEDVISVERYEAPHFEDFLGNSYFPPWVRLQTRQAGELCDFLLSAGGRWIHGMRQVNERAEELCGVLQRRLSMIRHARRRAD